MEFKSRNNFKAFPKILNFTVLVFYISNNICGAGFVGAIVFLLLIVIGHIFDKGGGHHGTS